MLRCIGSRWPGCLHLRIRLAGSGCSPSGYGPFLGGLPAIRCRYYWLVSIQKSDQVHLEHDQLQAQYDREPSQRYYHVPSDWLREKNELILFDELGENPRGIRLCEVRPIELNQFAAIQ